LRDRSYAFGRRGRLNQLKLSLIGARSTAAPRKKYALSVSHTGGILSRWGLIRRPHAVQNMRRTLSI